MCVAHVSILDLLVFTRHDHFTSKKKGGGYIFFVNFFTIPYLMMKILSMGRCPKNILNADYGQTLYMVKFGKNNLIENVAQN